MSHSVSPYAARPARRPAGLRVVRTGLLATVVASAATGLGAVVARTAGITLEASGGETIPPSGVAVVTGFFSLMGVGIAVGLLRRSARPADRFLRTTVLLTAASLVPPFLAGADPATVATLVALHLVAAAVVIPALTRSLRSA
jgi:hypothetical protein